MASRDVLDELRQRCQRRAPQQSGGTADARADALSYACSMAYDPVYTAHVYMRGGSRRWVAAGLTAMEFWQFWGHSAREYMIALALPTSTSPTAVASNALQRVMHGSRATWHINR